MPDVSHVAINEVDARAGLRSYLILGSLLLVPTLLGLTVAVRTGSHDWNLFYVAGGLETFVLLWLRSLRLRIADGELSSRRLLWTRKFNLSDIQRAETQLVGTSKGSYRALFIYPYPGKEQKPMRVPIGAFAKEDLKRVFDLLGDKFQGPRRIGVYTDESA